MKNIKYYILAYSMLIYLFLEKYMALLYLLCKIHFIDNNKNVDYRYFDGGKRFFGFEHYKKIPPTQIVQFCRLGQKNTLFKVYICMTNKYILIHMNKLVDIRFDFEDNLDRYIYAKRNIIKEKLGETLSELIRQNIEYYFTKKNAIIYSKQYNNRNGRSSRFLYRNK